jgi:polyhydroxyalkanoate synthase
MSATPPDPFEALGQWFRSIGGGPGAAAPPPALGPAREHQEAALRMQRLAAECLEHQSALARAWATLTQQASARVAAELADAAQAGKTPPPPRALYDTWIDHAERAFGTLARGDDYARTQAALVNAFARLRIEQRRAVEHAARQLDLPTRAEIDGLAARIAAMDGELRALRRRARGTGRSTAAAPPPAPAPDAAPGGIAGREPEAGCSAREIVLREGKLTLYRYVPIATPAPVAPVLVCYALVNRPWMMDLQPDRSLLRRLLERGLDIYLVDWGYPDGADRGLDLDDYVNRQLDLCMQHVLKAHGLPSANLLGVCQGGTFSLCYAALHPARVRNLVTMVTPVDFHTPDNLLAHWARDVDVDALVEAFGNVPGELLNLAFVALMPFRLMLQKYVEFAELAHDPEQSALFMRMEKWIFDSPDQAGAAFRQFVQWLFQQNRLARGQLELGGRAVDLREVRAPVLNVVGLRDHLVPPSASRPLGTLVGSDDYTLLEMDVGHIGMYVSARVQKQLPEAIASWLEQRQPTTKRGPARRQPRSRPSSRRSARKST